MARPSLAERFWVKVAIGSDEECWLWRSQTANGYGAFWRKPPLSRYAHRVAYELEIGPIPEGHHLHHRCGNMLCVNPRHLEPVTAEQHVEATPNHLAHRAACPKGHGYTTENTYYTSTGYRMCRACGHERHIRQRQRILQRRMIEVMEALTAREIVTRIVIAANCGQSPGSYRLNLAQKEAERILQELVEEQIAEMARHYGVEMTSE